MGFYDKINNNPTLYWWRNA